MCSLFVWSRCESPGPYVTIGTRMARPSMFMSPVPVFRNSVAVFPFTLLIEEANALTRGVSFSTSKGSFESSIVVLTITPGLAAK